MRLATLLFCLATPVLAQPTAEIVLLGEVHDNAEAHLGQAAALAELKPSAVVFEMLTPEEARTIDANRASAAAVWAETSWPDFSLYAPLFEALGEARILGAAAPRSEIRAVYAEGAAARFGPEAARFGLAEALPEAQQAQREEMQFQAHCQAMPREMMGGMVSVQRYRDALFARAALEALETYGPPVALIVGNGHARTDWGIPAALRAAAPEVTSHAIGFVEGTTEIPFDEIRQVPPAKRADPCKQLIQD